MQTSQISNLSYTDDGETIYGGSIGINKFIDLLVKRQGKDHKPFFEALLLNFYTMLRNCYDKDPKVVQKNIEQELVHLGTYVSDYFAATLGPNNPLKVPVVIYFPNYSQIQPPVARELNAEMRRLVSIAPRVKDILLKSLDGQRTFEMGNTVFYFKDVGNYHVLPYHQLDDVLSSLTMDKVSLFKRKSPYLLISHIPVDWHVVSQFPNGALLESYTAKIIPPSEFGDKLIGDKVTRNIPFSVKVHRIFGDKILVKPIVMRKVKKEMLVAAEKWKRKPTSMIVSDMARISNNSVGYINSLKL